MTQEVVSRPFARSFAEYAATDERVVCVTNDLTTSCEADEFRERFPDRFMSLGMAEQNIAGVLSGLAREGLIPVYPTFAVFATRRPYEQIAMNVAYPGLPVRIFGFLPGLSTPGGVTHQSIDDIALMSALPNMTVLEVGDATEIESVWDAIKEIPGPVYCRMLRGEVPRLFTTNLKVGEIREVCPGADVLVITTGLMTERATPTIAGLRAQGFGIRHVHLSTIKPFPADALARIISQTHYGVVTVENHLRFGGLAAATSAVIAERGLKRRLVPVAIPDTFATSGDMGYLFERFGLGPREMESAITSLLPLQADASGHVLNAEHQSPPTGRSAVEAL